MPEVAEVPREAALAQMRMIDGFIAGRRFIAGERYTIADIAAMVALGLGALVGPTVDSGLAKPDALVGRGVGAAERLRLMGTAASATSRTPAISSAVSEIAGFRPAGPKVRVHLPPAVSLLRT
jgi:glutathione S-transferase